MSSGLVGSSIQYGSNGASRAIQSIAVADVPALVGVDRQHPIRADLLADDPDPSDVIVEVRADLHLEPGPAVGERLAAQPPDLVVVVAQPADRRGVGRVAVAQQLGLALLRGRGRPVRGARVPRSGVSASVMYRKSTRPTISSGDISLSSLPQRHAGPLCHEVPGGVDDGRRREVDDALLGPDPAQLAVAHERRARSAPRSASSAFDRIGRRPAAGAHRRPRPRPRCRARS